MEEIIVPNVTLITNGNISVGRGIPRQRSEMERYKYYYFWRRAGKYGEYIEEHLIRYMEDMHLHGKMFYTKCYNLWNTIDEDRILPGIPQTTAFEILLYPNSPSDELYEIYELLDYESNEFVVKKINEYTTKRRLNSQCNL